MTDRGRVHALVHALGSVALDRVYRVDRLPGADDKAMIESVIDVLGGPNTRLALALGHWGAPVRLTGVVGQDGAGEALLAAVAAEGLDTGGIWRAADVATPVNPVILDAAGERAILIQPTPEAVLERIGAATVPGAGDLVTAHLFHPEAVQAVFGRARRAGALTALDLERPELMRWGVDRALAAVAEADLVCTNAQMVTWWGGRHGGASRQDHALKDDALGLARWLAGPGRTVCVTLGVAGVLALHDSQPFWVPALQVAPRDTTGAGDTFLAALLWARQQGHDLDVAVRLASAAAGLYVAGGLPAWTDVVAAAVGLTATPQPSEPA